ncbi:MAG: hypothetical protein IJ318_01535 [Clostridia bacterium]|nr:hypothetical protein [Clostridia bacterium]
MAKKKIESLIIPFPSVPQIENELQTTTKERLAMYDIITRAFMFKYTYEKAKEAHKPLPADKNLHDLRVYGKFLSEVNEKISDPFLRDFVLASLKNLKNNDYSRPSVKKTYETVRTWFCPDNLKGKIFRNNLASGTSYESIDFRNLFLLCETQAITENSPLFAEVKTEYAKFKQQYEDLLK